MPNLTNTESQDQIAIVEYLSILEKQKKVLWFTGSGNGQYQKSWMVKAKMQREGIRAGMPDFLICFPHNLVFIEMKREKGGKLTDEQKHAIECINAIGDTSGVVSAYVAYGFKEAKSIIDGYL